MKRSKSRITYDSLIKFGENFFNDENAVPVLIEAVILMYKCVLNERRQDMALPLKEEDVFESPNNNFSVIVDCYAEIDSKEVKRKITEIPEYRDLVKNMLGKMGKKSSKRMKKKTSHIFKCIRKAVSKSLFDANDKALMAAFLAFHFSIRESFINIRMTLKPAWFHSIPTDLEMVLEDGTGVKISDLFTYDDLKNRHMLDKGKLTRDELLILQTNIVKFFFKQIYPRFN